MVTETESEIESIDVANDDLIDVLGDLLAYEQTNGASGTRPRLDVIGDGSRKMAVPSTQTNVDSVATIYANELLEDGDVVETVEINGSEVIVQVL